nr:hypothetical protein [Tanacetum cinerariifolium]
MLLCKQAEQGVPLQAEQYDWLADTDKEVDEQELEAHYSYMAKIQEVPTANSSIDSEPVEQDDIQKEQNDVESDDEPLVATAQADQDHYCQTSRSHKSHAPSSKPLIPTRSHITTRHKGKEIAKPITPPSETASEEDNNAEQAQRDKDMQKNLALIAKYFKKIYKPT